MIAAGTRLGVTGFSDVQIARDGEAYAYTYTRRLTDLYIAEGLE